MEGLEFLGYVKQVVQQMGFLESRYINDLPEKQRFCVSSQHYTFGANAFVELVQQFGQERYEFILNETQIHQIIKDVRNRISDLGIFCLVKLMKVYLSKFLRKADLNFMSNLQQNPMYF